jgi:signal transduction histidine kinase
MTALRRAALDPSALWDGRDDDPELVLPSVERAPARLARFRLHALEFHPGLRDPRLRGTRERRNPATHEDQPPHASILTRRSRAHPCALVRGRVRGPILTLGCRLGSHGCEPERVRAKIRPMSATLIRELAYGSVPVRNVRSTATPVGAERRERPEPVEATIAAAAGAVSFGAVAAALTLASAAWFAVGVSSIVVLIALVHYARQAHEELAHSRTRLAAAAEDARRRVVRDLHDGAQQRLVNALISMQLAERELASDPDAARKLLDEAIEQGKAANRELRDLARGIRPAMLAREGLPAALEALAAGMPIPVDTDVAVGRCCEPVEAAAYFVAAEALTNVVKHADAGHACVRAHTTAREFVIEVHDDGVGGARPHGSGLVGLAERVAAFGGRLRVDSPPGRGTLISGVIPIP